MLAKARIVSPSKVSSTGMSPTSSARWVAPSARSSSTRPTHAHDPATKLRRSQSSTACEVYDSTGSIVDWPNGSSARDSPSASTGAIGDRDDTSDTVLIGCSC